MLLGGEDGGGGGVVLDMGAGPSICNIIAASRWSSHIYLAELLEGNRKEIQKFLDKDYDAWNWQPYFDFQVIISSNHSSIIGSRHLETLLTNFIHAERNLLLCYDDQKVSSDTLLDMIFLESTLTLKASIIHSDIFVIRLYWR